MRRLTAIAVVTSAAVAVLAAPAAADTRPPLDPAALAAAISGLPNEEASGALLQVRGDDGRWRGTSGVANVHTGQRVPADGRFRIGSMTKTFTATAALQLVAKGRLELHRSVQSYAPDVLPAEFPPITVDQLLTYTSGLPSMEIDHKDPVWFLRHRFDTWTPRQLFDLAFYREDGTVKDMRFAPGTAQNYGNIDYLVLGAVIEKVTGRPYGDAIRAGIIRPLRLSATTVPGADTRIHGPHARGYELNDGTYTDITDANPTYQWAAAEMISNAPDLDRFLVALLSGKLLPKAQTALLFRIPDVKVHESDQNAYLGHGIARLPVGDIVFWGKTGDRPGYNNGMAATRDLGRRVVFSVNTLHMGGREQPVVSQKIIAAVAGLA
ncbi:serine hydrolase domain-containing protein [Actinophytocola algeriensis]|uniref:D-alanyl-D-alanine carboxypeptidase n=1 Tax=Actinophytocola algeriensis TaxID=1768010 RepID=A0A7W7VJB0_9PSEU|nr:serine hydrolase domain-containing protein [Actinophytocola algeriensis]MBB4912149.1 D-alanyl-D-alanine carboxypeptidase [Actinophytocola algeriensis]MBE1477359.1 D-alanyl-D-alanine carboxypeptidase [Actinophytocola algeriensis]